MKLIMNDNKRRRSISILSAIAIASTGLILSMAPASRAATFVSLGTADNFAVLAGAGITNTGATTIVGDIGTHPTITYVGSGSVTQSGTYHAGDAVTQTAKTDLSTAFTSLAGQVPVTLTTAAVAGGTLTTGIVNSASSLNLSGNIVLDAAGNANAVFIFQAVSAIITAPSTKITIINSGQACNVFYVAGSSVTIDTATQLVGNVLASANITDNGGSTVSGRLLAKNGSVTLNNTSVTRATCAAAVVIPPAVTCTISNLLYTPTAAGSTTGKLSWTQTGQQTVLFSGPPALYPAPYNYGSFTASWAGNLVNLVPGTSYPVSVTVRSSTGCQITASTTAFNSVVATPTPTPTPTPVVTPTPTPVVTPTPTPTPTPVVTPKPVVKPKPKPTKKHQVKKFPKGGVNTGDGSLASKFHI